MFKAQIRATSFLLGTLSQFLADFDFFLLEYEKTHKKHLKTWKGNDLVKKKIWTCGEIFGKKNWTAKGYRWLSHSGTHTEQPKRLYFVFYQQLNSKVLMRANLVFLKNRNLML